MPASEEATGTLPVEELGPLSAEYYLSTLEPKTREAYLSKNITIPLKEEGEEVVIDSINDLPEDSSELCTLLTNEESSPEHWLVVAKAYANQGKVEEALNVIKSALNAPHIVDSTGDVQATLHGFLPWLYLTKEGRSGGTVSFDLALTETKTALSLDPTNEVNMLSQAVLMLSSKQQKSKRTNFEKESRIFGSLLQRNPKNCYALMGRAKIYFYKENYVGALKLFQRVLTLNPLIRPDPRIGIGLCFWLLDKKVLANQAWQNSIQVNPEKNLEAKILISIAKFDDCFTGSSSDADFKEKYAEALEFAKASYIEDPSNEVINIIVASYYFSKGKYDVVERICENIVSNDKASAAVKSDALFWLARCKFVEKDYIQAQKLFSDSIKNNENNILSRFGYGQCLVLRNEINDAIRAFEKVQELNPKLLEVMYSLGMLYARNSKQSKKSIAFLEKYVTLSKEQGEPISSSALATLSTLYEDKDISQSLKYLVLLKDQELAAGKSESELSFALLNNIGVLSLLKNENDSLALFEAALRSLEESSEDKEKIDALEITLKYNLARCKESQNNSDSVKDAMTIYEEILSKCPHYTSAKLRWLLLTCLSNDDSIQEEVSKLLEEESDDLEVRSFYGWYVRKFGKKHHLTSSKNKDLESEHHRETLVNHTSHDCYALISLGNVYCSLAREAKDSQKKDQYYVRAAQLYQKVLSIDPRDAYAAQGIAIIFADKKQTGLALEIFRKVRESLQDISVYLNLGHCLLEAKQYAKGIESYQLALTRFTNGEDPNILNFISRAWLYRASHEKNLDYFKTALDFAEKAFKLNSSASYKFNIAFIQFQIAEFVKRLTLAKRSMTDLEQGLVGLEQAIKSLNELTTDEKHPPFPAEELKLRANMGNTLTKQLEKAILDQKSYEQELETKLREAKKIKTLEDQKKLEQKLKEEEERKKLEEKLAAERKQLEETSKEWNQQRLDEDKDNKDELDINEDDDKKSRKKGGAKKNAKKQPKKKKKEFVVSEEEESADESRSGSGSESSGAEPDGDEEDEQDTNTKKRRKGGRSDETTKKRKVLQKQRKSSLSKATIDDSDEDLEDDLFNEDASGDEEAQDEVQDEEKVTRTKAKVIDDEEEE